MFKISLTGQFKKDLKLAKKRGLNLDSLFEVVNKLANDEQLPASNHNHMLHGTYKGYWECHISPDWLLIYEKDIEIRIISLYRTDTHSDLFR